MLCKYMRVLKGPPDHEALHLFIQQSLIAKHRDPGTFVQGAAFFQGSRLQPGTFFWGQITRLFCPSGHFVEIISDVKNNTGIFNLYPSGVVIVS